MRPAGFFFAAFFAAVIPFFVYGNFLPFTFGIAFLLMNAVIFCQRTSSACEIAAKGY